MLATAAKSNAIFLNHLAIYCKSRGQISKKKLLKNDVSKNEKNKGETFIVHLENIQSYHTALET